MEDESRREATAGQMAELIAVLARSVPKDVPRSVMQAALTNSALPDAFRKAILGYGDGFNVYSWAEFFRQMNMVFNECPEYPMITVMHREYDATTVCHGFENLLKEVDTLKLQRLRFGASDKLDFYPWTVMWPKDMELKTILFLCSRYFNIRIELAKGWVQYDPLALRETMSILGCVSKVKQEALGFQLACLRFGGTPEMWFGSDHFPTIQSLEESWDDEQAPYVGITLEECLLMHVKHFLQTGSFQINSCGTGTICLGTTLDDTFPIVYWDNEDWCLRIEWADRDDSTFTRCMTGLEREDIENLPYLPRQAIRVMF
jgi:hypothetical protein